MQVLTHDDPLKLWQAVVKEAEHQCSLHLREELEVYLIDLLVRYTNKPEIVKQLVATVFLEAAANPKKERIVWQDLGDQCLIFAGLFPKLAERRLVKIGYFVGIGQSAYAKISDYANDLYSLLSTQFIALMDVLQAIRHDQTMLPLEAYEQWTQVGSRRALQILQTYTHGSPIKNL